MGANVIARSGQNKLTPGKSLRLSNCQTNETVVTDALNECQNSFLNFLQNFRANILLG